MATETVSPVDFQYFAISEFGDAGIPHVTQEDNPHSEAYRLTILKMDESQVRDFIVGDIREQEDIRYTHGNTAEHKLLFMATPDVAEARTKDGRPAYSDENPYPKFNEVDEFRNAISDHFHREPDKPHVLSEAADLFYNLLLLSVLHPEHDKREYSLRQEWLQSKGLPAERYKRSNYQYMKHFDNLASALGFSKIEALRIAAVKYHQRLFVLGAKSAVDEERILGDLESPFEEISYIHFPTDAQLKAGFTYASRMGDSLEGNLNRVQSQIEYRLNGYVYKKQKNKGFN